MTKEIFFNEFFFLLFYNGKYLYLNKKYLLSRELAGEELHQLEEALVGVVSVHQLGTDLALLRVPGHHLPILDTVVNILQ